MGVEALALHGIHDSVLISGRKSVIICVMLGRQCVRLDFFILSSRGDHGASIKTENVILGRTMWELRRLLSHRSLAYKGFKQFRRGSQLG